MCYPSGIILCCYNLGLAQNPCNFVTSWCINCFCFLYKNNFHKFFCELTARCCNFQLEQSVNEVEKFYLNTSIKQPNTSKNTSSGKHKVKDRHVPGFKKLQQEASRREAAAAKRMQELMRQFGTILRQAILNICISNFVYNFWIHDWPHINGIYLLLMCQITQHKWAWPFMQPVDVEGLGLHDYYEVKHLAFSLMKLKMLFWFFSIIWFSYLLFLDEVRILLTKEH